MGPGGPHPKYGPLSHRGVLFQGNEHWAGFCAKKRTEGPHGTSYRQETSIRKQTKMTRAMSDRRGRGS